MQSSLVRRSAINIDGSGTPDDIELCRVRLLPGIDKLPASIGERNLMIASWAVGFFLKKNWPEGLQSYIGVGSIRLHRDRVDNRSRGTGCHSTFSM